MDFYSNIKKGTIICFLFLISCFSFLIWQGIFLPKELLGRETIFAIDRGQGLFQISENLEAADLIKDRHFFNLYVLSKRNQGKLQAGEYLLSPSMAIPEIAQRIIAGDTLQIKITVPEGFTLKQIEERLSEKLARKISLSFLVGEFKNDFDFLEDVPSEAALEGFLFPDTYFFKINENEKEIVQKFLANFNKKLTPELREEIKSQKKSVFEIIIAASIIEEEVQTLEDKKLVSGILWKRLEAGKPLESCATIAYILGIDKWRYSFEDTRTESPYNTYLNPGLPPGPISNPGLESVLAALYPENSQYWYFLSTPEGETIFSRTLEEHNLAKARYLRP